MTSKVFRRGRAGGTYAAPSASLTAGFAFEHTIGTDVPGNPVLGLPQRSLGTQETAVAARAQRRRRAAKLAQRASAG